MIKFLYKIFNFYSLKKYPNRVYIQDVKPNQLIQIEWEKIQTGIGYVKCINNDPKTKKILLQVTWNNYIEAKTVEKERFILSYDSKRLANFHLLNQFTLDEEDGEDETSIPDLQKKMFDAITKEDYEKAAEYRNKIQNLLKLCWK